MLQSTHIDPSQYLNALPLVAIQVTGTDCAEFLQQQLTQDILKMNQEACAFCYCQHQGKIIANGLILKLNVDVDVLKSNVFLLIVEKSIATIFIKKISMFILRAKVHMQILDWTIFSTPELPNHIASKKPIVNNNQIYFNFLNFNYTILKQAATNMNTGDMLPHQKWLAQQIYAKFTWINQNTSARFTPHMLGLENLAVNFKKGCYPGQEVVARTQYLGKNKKELKMIEIKRGDVNFDHLILEDIDFNKKNFSDFANSIEALAAYLLLDQEGPIGDIVQAALIDDNHYLLMLCGQK